MYKSIFIFLLLLISDISSVFISVYLSHIERVSLNVFSNFEDYSDSYDQYFSQGLFFLVLISFYTFGLYAKRYDFWEELKNIIKALLLTLVLSILLVFATKTSNEYSRSMILIIFLNLLWIMPLFRIIIKWLLSYFKLWQKYIWICGDSEQVANLRPLFEKNWYFGYLPTMDSDQAQVVAIATKDIPVNELEEMIYRYKQQKKEIFLLPYLHQLSFANSDVIDFMISRVSLFSLQNQLFKSRNIVIKKISELFIIMVFFPFAFIVFLLLALWVKLDSKGSIFFKQKRLGKNGKLFSCYKFRTMREGSEEDLKDYLKENPSEVDYFNKYHKYSVDPRFTRAGKWIRKLSLDELPQIFNVLRGDMNLVGPRPYMREEGAKIESSKDIILHVKPGITGLWQVAGRNDLSFDERVDIDIWYIQNWSLWLDFVIFIKTFQVLISRRGAS